jgi:hypothetical protein
MGNKSIKSQEAEAGGEKEEEITILNSEEILQDTSQLLKTEVLRHSH